MKNLGKNLEKNAKMQKIEKKAAGGPPGSDLWLKRPTKKGSIPTLPAGCPQVPAGARRLPAGCPQLWAPMGAQRAPNGAQREPKGAQWSPLGPNGPQNLEKIESSTKNHENWSIFFFLGVDLESGLKILDGAPNGPHGVQWAPI